MTTTVVTGWEYRGMGACECGDEWCLLYRPTLVDPVRAVLEPLLCRTCLTALTRKATRHSIVISRLTVAGVNSR